MTGPLDDPPPRKIGRYTLGGLVATGGMAEVHLGQIRGAIGFSRTVAIKRMHPHLASDPDFASMFADEARLAARVRHPNVVATLDVVLEGANLCIVMEYIEGVTLAQLLKLGAEQSAAMPPRIAVAILRDTLEGLHAAHHAVDSDGRPLGIVHRDVSPQNVIVGVDGVARVLDFGIAKANVRLHQTREGSGLKGKLAYMAPEQLEGAAVVRQSDVFAASIVLWETLTAQRAYGGASEGEVVTKILRGPPPPPSSVRDDLGQAYDDVLMRGLARAPEDRFESARHMAVALTTAGEPASAAEVGAWVERIAAAPLKERAQRARLLETHLLDGEAPAAVETDPDATKAASPAGLEQVKHVKTGGEATPSADAPPSSAAPVATPASDVGPLSAGARVTPAASRTSRFRVAALVVAACGMTAVAMLAWAERRAPSPGDRSGESAANASSASPPSGTPVPSSAQPTTSAVASAPVAVPAASGSEASPARTPVTPSKIRKPLPRGTSGISRGGIPDRL
ncbi:MAG: protein kinase [Myxococcaceae bacterium]|nr:protein kinase [Myxococcaceae bacterium]